jgi:Fe2+ transport system protein FeoA
MMRLSLAPVGEINPVKAIWVDDKTKAMLEEVGITIDREVFVVVEPCCDTLIVGVNNRRIAMSEEIAHKIIV